MAPVYKIALIQLCPKPLAIDYNYEKAVAFIRDAASQGCDLAVLPEYHLTSWVPDEPEFLSLCHHDVTSKYLSGYQSLASELKISIVPGTICTLHPETSLLHNTAHFISPEGKILSSYTKKNLWHPERPHLTSSTHDPHTTFESPLGKIGMLICWDAAFPEAFRELISQGAKLIIIPTFWTLSDCTPAGLARNPLSEELFVQSMLVSRAFENTCGITFCNAGAPIGKGKENAGFLGISQVTVPFQGAVGRMGREEGMNVVELDMKILEEAEEAYKVRMDMEGKDWHYAHTLKRKISNEESKL
ncbi:hypothetical protein OCU04_008393 [Sclerotinia nivalis]|uniref:CN hydrolase domain-containing protein n=1 Tax=Sclerotinia nivalis TaxID=352851 RepID=A0A9X0DIS5_9HELO|nr:hypothetical protein OCU04_008393 [Sclerotinia nivalis]